MKVTLKGDFIIVSLNRNVETGLDINSTFRSLLRT